MHLRNIENTSTQLDMRLKCGGVRLRRSLISPQ